MKRLIGAAIAAIALAWAGSAAAISYITVDFEGSRTLTPSGAFYFDTPEEFSVLARAVDAGDPKFAGTGSTAADGVTIEAPPPQTVFTLLGFDVFRDANAADDAALSFAVVTGASLSGTTGQGVYVFTLAPGIQSATFTLADGVRQNYPNDDYGPFYGYLNINNTGVTPGLQIDNIRLQVSAIPEPATWAMLITGFGLAGASLRRRRQTPLNIDPAVVI
jgi:hypothetical protein